MKKKIVGVLGASVLLLGLASCGSNYEVGKISNKDREDYTDIIKEHVEKKEESIVDKDSKDELKFSAYTNYDNEKYTYLGQIGSYFRLKNEKNYIGFYDPFEGQFIVKPQFISEYYNSAKITYSNNNFTVLEIKYGGKYYYYDNFGNELFKDSVVLDFQLSTTKNGVYYYSVSDDNTIVNYLEYKPSDNGKVTILKEIPIVNKKEYNKDDLYAVYSQTLYKDDKTYSAVVRTYNNSLVGSVYDEANALVKTFELPFITNYNNLILFGNGNFMYQYSTELTFDTKDYQYSVGMQKYSYYTVQGNVFDDSKTKTVEVPYVLNASKNLYNKDDDKVKGIYKENNYFVTVMSILEDKTLGPKRYYLMNDDFSLANELQFSPNNLTKTQNGYYDSGRYIVLNDKFEALTYLNDTAQYNKDIDGFVLQVNGKYGIVNSLGKVQVLFEYDNINGGYVLNNKVYATKDGKLGILDVSSNTFTQLPDNVTSLETNGKLLMSYDAKTKKTTIYGLTGTQTYDGQFTKVREKRTLFGYKCIIYNNLTGDELKQYTITLNDYQFKSNGTDTTTEYVINDGYEKAVDLSVGSANNIKLFDGSNFFKITFEDGIYKFVTNADFNTGYPMYLCDISDGSYLDDISFTRTIVDTDNYNNPIYEYTLNSSVNAGTYAVEFYYNNGPLFTDITFSKVVTAA